MTIFNAWDWMEDGFDQIPTRWLIILKSIQGSNRFVKRLRSRTATRDFTVDGVRRLSADRGQRQQPYKRPNGETEASCGQLGNAGDSGTWKRRGKTKPRNDPNQSEQNASRPTARLPIVAQVRRLAGPPSAGPRSLLER